MLVCAKGTRNLEATGVPLGLFCSSPYGVQKVQLEPGECLLLYTDGLTEARNKSNEEYGISRLAKTVGERYRAPAQDIVGVCLNDLRAFLSGASKTDDLAIMAVRRVS